MMPKVRFRFTPGSLVTTAIWMNLIIRCTSQTDTQQTGGGVDDRGSPSNVVSITDLPKYVVNSCSSFNLTSVHKGQTCGAPWATPCFDFSRCGSHPSIYVYDKKCSLADSSQLVLGGTGTQLRSAAMEAGVLAETYESACVFLHVDTPHETPCATVAPLWNEGANHMMIDIADSSRDQRPSYYDSYAMEAATSQHTCHYRSGYDISISHGPRVVFHDLQSITPESRQYFLTFKGSLYFNHHGFEERASIEPLHDDPQGVVIAQRCYKRSIKFWPEEGDLRQQYLDYCARIQPRYDSYDFRDLMNTTFALVPAGGSPGTFRLPEVMSAEAIPVMVVRDWVKPYTEVVDWPSFSFTFSPDQVPLILETLRAVPEDTLRTMQQKSLEAYWKIYVHNGETNHKAMAHLVVKILVERLNHHRI